MNGYENGTLHSARLTRYNSRVTKLLEQAIERLRQMPEERQDSLATLMLHEIEADEQWSRSTAAHAEKLRGLIDDVLAADGRDECEPLDVDRL